MNKLCTPVPHPEYPEDYFVSVFKSMVNDDMLAKEGPGLSWFRSSRLTQFYHLPLSAFFKLAIWDYQYKKILNDKLKMLCEKENNND